MPRVTQREGATEQESEQPWPPLCLPGQFVGSRTEGGERRAWARLTEDSPHPRAKPRALLRGSCSRQRSSRHLQH